MKTEFKTYFTGMLDTTPFALWVMRPLLPTVRDQTDIVK